MVKSAHALALLACMAVAGIVQARLEGGVIRVDAAASAAASADIGFDVTVTRLYFGFTEADDVLISVTDASIRSFAAQLYQDAFGADHANGINPALFMALPSSQWDSFVGIGGPHFQGSGFGGDVDLDFAWSSIGVASGGWFATPNGDGDLAGTSELGPSGLYEVFGGQFTIQGDFTFPGARGASDIGNGFVASGLFFTDLRANWVEFQGDELISTRLRFPAPGATVVFGFAGVFAARRRR